MRTLGTVAEAVEFRAAAPSPVVLVPTMGALHEGHASLVDAARNQAGPGGSVVVSIFVNPTQFGPGEDLARYPSTPGEDFQLCRDRGADAVFTPDAAELYPPGCSTFVEETVLSQGLCGTFRPGHFRGVCTIVAKLLMIIRPDAAIFGEKDYQQLAVIRRMVRDLLLPVEIFGLPTVRETDGLALSSRNRYLSPTERKRAAFFPAALQLARKLATNGEISGEAIVSAVREAVTSGTGTEPQYVELVCASDLSPLTVLDQPAVLAAAVRIGETRLIDNLRLEPPHGKG